MPDLPSHHTTSAAAASSAAQTNLVVAPDDLSSRRSAAAGLMSPGEVDTSAVASERPVAAAGLAPTCSSSDSMTS